MNVIKKDGKQVTFDLNKMKRAVERANKETQELTEADVLDVVNVIHGKLLKITREISSKEIQKMVEDTLMRKKFYETARSYIEYRYQKELDKKAICDQIYYLIDKKQEEYYYRLDQDYIVQEIIKEHSDIPAKICNL